MLPRTGIMVAPLVALVACGATQSSDGSDGAAVGICREAVNSTARWSSTVRTEGAEGFVVKIWSQPQPSGAPDYVCEARLDPAQPRGLAITTIAPAPAP
jgi:hypothetical protein